MYNVIIRSPRSILPLQPNSYQQEDLGTLNHDGLLLVRSCAGNSSPGPIILHN